MKTFGKLANKPKALLKAYSFGYNGELAGFV
jgi:hypothetical protein